MNNILDFGCVDHVSLTVLVDNKADLIVKSSDHIQYFTDKPLLAEHGFSVLIQLEGLKNRILWDTGGSRVALIENMRRMKLDFSSIGKIALSHGHFDHYAAMTDLLTEMDLIPDGKKWGAAVDGNEIEPWLDSFRIPIIAHPAAFRERWWKKKDGSMVGPELAPPEDAWKAAGAKVILSEGPYKLASGCWSTGYVPRASFETSGIRKELRYRIASSYLQDEIEEDQAIIINVKKKGLVVLSGCAHSGIVNTINYAKEISGIDSIYAIVGGFHLARAHDEDINRTIDFIQNLEPSLVVPCHCTGFKAICRFADEMPEAFVEGVVGTTYRI